MELDSSGQPISASGNLPERTVSELSAAIRQTVEESFALVRVRGEIGKVSRPGSGHIYLDLKDDSAVVACVVWRSAATRLATMPEQGLEVVVTGRVTTFAGQSKYQIVVDTLEPAGAGALMALLETRRKKLEAEGLFATERKRPLPSLPHVIGVITSPSGSVIRDILHRIADRFPLHVLIWPIRVQGESCGPEVAAAIRGFNEMASNSPIPRPDLLIVARGGGSLEDLWGFNDEEAVRAAAQSGIPLVSAIGHETDWTLIDLAADYRAPTPTGAAEIAVPVKEDLVRGVATIGARLANCLRQRLERARTELRAAVRGLGTPDEILSVPRQRLDTMLARLSAAFSVAGHRKRSELVNITSRLSPGVLMRRFRSDKATVAGLAQRGERAFVVFVARHGDKMASIVSQLSAGKIERVVAAAGERLDRCWRLLSGLSHEKVLARGFALIEGVGGGTITNAGGLHAGDPFAVRFHDGRVRAVASEAETPRRKNPRHKRRDEPRQGDLLLGD